MSLADLLRREAGQMAATLKKNLPGITNEKRRLEQSRRPQSGHAERLALLTREEHASINGPARLAAYRPDMTVHPDCPYCWMLQGRHKPLMPDLVQPGTLVCPHCGGRYIEWL